MMMMKIVLFSAAAEASDVEETERRCGEDTGPEGGNNCRGRSTDK